MITRKYLSCRLAIRHNWSGFIIRFDKGDTDHDVRKLMVQRWHNDNPTSRSILAAEENSLSKTPILVENHGFTLNARKLAKYFDSSWMIMPVVLLFFLNAQQASADPVGDFFKKVGNTISKAFQAQPEQHQTKKTTKRVSQRPAAPESNVGRAAPSPFGEIPPPVPNETPPPTVLRASVVPPEKAKGDMPYGIPVPGRKGMVTSPYLPDGSYIDVNGFPAGTPVKDPFTGKIILVP
jgi:hypothetical protein